MSFKWMPVFATGKHIPKSGRMFDATEERLLQIVEATKRAAGKLVPFVFNHPHPKNEASVSFGGFDASDIRLNGNVIEILPKEVNADVAEQFNTGKFRGVSVKIGADSAIKHVGFLTHSRPAVNLPVYEFESGEGDEEFEAFGDGRVSEIGTILRNLRDRMIEKDGVEEADKVFPPWVIDDLLQWRPDVPEWVITTIDNLRAQVDEITKNKTVTSYFSGGSDMSIEELQAENAQNKAAIARLEAANLALQEQNRAAEFEKFCGSDEMKGRITPAIKPRVAEIAKQLDAETAVEFSSGKRTVLDEFKEVLKLLPKSVEFGSPTRDNPAAPEGDGESEGARIAKLRNQRNGGK